MQLNSQSLILGASIATCVVLLSLLFSLTEITTSMFLTFNISPLLSALISPTFIILLLLFAFTIALVMLCGKNNDTATAIIIPLFAILVGGIGSFLFFTRVEIIVLTIASCLAVPFTVRFIPQKEAELKYLPHFRAGTAAAGRFLAIITIMCIAYLLFVGYLTQTTLAKTVVDEVITATMGSEDSLERLIQAPLVNGMIESQKGTLTVITQLPEYTVLARKNDTDTRAFLLALERLKTALASEEYKTTITTSMERQMQLDIGKDIIAQLPFFSTITSYAWIWYALSAFILITFIHEVIIKNIAGVVYWGITKFYKIPQPKQKTKQNK